MKIKSGFLWKPQEFDMSVPRDTHQVKLKAGSGTRASEKSKLQSTKMKGTGDPSEEYFGIRLEMQSLEFVQKVLLLLLSIISSFCPLLLFWNGTMHPLPLYNIIM